MSPHVVLIVGFCVTEALVALAAILVWRQLSSCVPGPTGQTGAIGAVGLTRQQLKQMQCAAEGRKKVDRLDKLRSNRAAMIKQSQPSDPADTFKVRVEIAALEGELRALVASRVLEYLSEWEKRGTFEAVRYDGKLATANLVKTEGPLRDLRRLHFEAQHLARWSLGLDTAYSLYTGYSI